MRTVVFSMVDITKDREPQGPQRWEIWHPTLALLMQEDLRVDRLELIIHQKQGRIDGFLADIQAVSPETEVVVHEPKIQDFEDFEETYGALHDLLRHRIWKADEEDYLFHITTGSRVSQICTFKLTESRHFPGKLIQTSPSKRRKSGVKGSYHIVDLDLFQSDLLAARFHTERSEQINCLKAGIETRNRTFNEMMEHLETVALNTPDPILLTGPTGAGKSALARRIHNLKNGRNLVQGPYVEFNCATLHGSAALSALFGHKKGAFTGAMHDRQGLLRAGDGGLVFLDEIGELGLDEQAMLLRAIEEKNFLPLGSDKEVSSSFQLICATNRNLKQDVQEGRFRRDLLARINTWVFEMPGLKDRREDIEPNLDFELERYARETGNRVEMNREAREAFLSFAGNAQACWAGNFRDLAGAVTRMSTLARGGRIGIKDVTAEQTRLRESWQHETPGRSLELPADLKDSIDLESVDPFDRSQLIYVLQVCRSSRSLSEAGRKLFSISRENKKSVNDADRLRKYLMKFGLGWAQIKESGPPAT